MTDKVSTTVRGDPASSSPKTIRPYLWSAIFLAVLGVVLLAGFAVYLFTRNLEIARQASRERMANLADYIVEYLERDLLSYTLILTPESMPANIAAEKRAWLGRLAKATGLEHVALTDSVGTIYIANQIDYAGGSSIIGLGANAACLDSAAHLGTPIYCLRQQGSLALQSLYHPFDFFGSRHLIVLESDSNFLAYLEQYRAFIWAVVVFLVFVLGGLITAMIFIDGKARAALQLSRRNEQLAILGQTSAELAHELKNPLAIIKASVDVLRKQLDPERKNQAFNFLSDEVMRLSRLISNILGLSRERALDIRPFAPAAALDGAVKAMREIHPDIDIQVTIEKEMLLQGDLDAVRQISENLLRNASQAMGGKGKCHVHCRTEKEKACLWIGDEGPGIPPELRKSLFDPFVSGNKAGTGLGLAIVRNLIERMGWHIELLHDEAASQAMGNATIRTCFKLSSPLPKPHSAQPSATLSESHA